MTNIFIIKETHSMRKAYAMSHHPFDFTDFIAAQRAFLETFAGEENSAAHVASESARSALSSLGVASLASYRAELALRAKSEAYHAISEALCAAKADLEEANEAFRKAERFKRASETNYRHARISFQDALKEAAPAPAPTAHVCTCHQSWCLGWKTSQGPHSVSFASPEGICIR